jgi:hypothetical protein
MTPTSTTEKLLAHLHTLHIGGMTEQHISKAVGLSLPRVGQLLLYQRWRQWAYVHAVEVELSERRFRAYWFEMRQAHLTQGKRAVDTAYEADVFAEIAAWVAAGKPPSKKGTVFKPKTAAEILRAAYPITALRKDVQRRWHHQIARVFVRLQFAFHASRSTYTPSSQADYARTLTRHIKAIIDLLAHVHPTYHQEVKRLYEKEGLKTTLDQQWSLLHADRASWSPTRDAPAAQLVRRTVGEIMRMVGRIDVDAAVYDDQAAHPWTLRAAQGLADYPYLTAGMEE